MPNPPSAITCAIDGNGNHMFGFERQLIFWLRLRGISDSAIADIVGEARLERLAATGVKERSEIGTPNSYAKHFPRGTTKSFLERALRIGNITVAVYIVIGLGFLLLAGLNFADAMGPVLLWPAVGLLVVTYTTGLLGTYLTPVRTRPV
jgi:hypothetical protein